MKPRPKSGQLHLLWEGMGLLYTHILPLRQGSHLQRTVVQSSNQLARICTNAVLVSHISLAYHPNLFCHPESRLHTRRHGISVNFTRFYPRTHYLKEREEALIFAYPSYQMAGLCRLVLMPALGRVVNTSVFLNTYSCVTIPVLVTYYVIPVFTH